MTSRDAYLILGVKPGDDLKQIRVAYRELVKRWHPDRYPDDEELRQSAERQIKLVNLAYEKVREEESRPSVPDSSPVARPEPEQRQPEQHEETWNQFVSFETRFATRLRYRQKARRITRALHGGVLGVVLFMLIWAIGDAYRARAHWMHGVPSAVGQNDSSAVPRQALDHIDTSRLHWGDPSPEEISGSVYNRSSFAVQGEVMLHVLIWDSAGNVAPVHKSIPLFVDWNPNSSEDVRADVGLAYGSNRFPAGASDCAFWFEGPGPTRFHFYRLTYERTRHLVIRLDHAPTRHDINKASQMISPNDAAHAKSIAGSAAISDISAKLQRD